MEKLPEQKADINIVDADKFETGQVEITDNNKDDQNGSVTAEEQKNMEAVMRNNTIFTEDHKDIENSMQAAQPVSVKCEA